MKCVFRWRKGKQIDCWPCLLLPGQQHLVVKQFESTTIMKSVPLRSGPLPPSFKGSIPGRWDPVKQWLFPRLGGQSGGAVLVDPARGFTPSTLPRLKNNSQLSPAGWCAFDQPNEGCWHFLWSGDCLSIYIKIFMLIWGSGDYFQAGLAIRAAVLSGAIRWAGKSNQLRVLQSNALCRLNLDPWHWWRSPEKGVDKPNCLFQHYFARDQVQSNVQWICSLLAGLGEKRAEVSLSFQ